MNDVPRMDKTPPSHTVFTVRDHSPLPAVVAALSKYGVKVLLVVNDSQNVVGIINHRDVTKHLAQDLAAAEKTAADIMTPIVHAAPYLRVGVQGSA
jgi:CBS domain-containing protein